MFLPTLPMMSRKVDLLFENIGQWRRKWSDVSISLPQPQIGLSESCKLYLNLYSGRWFKPNLNLVNNLTPLGLWQLVLSVLILLSVINRFLLLQIVEVYNEGKQIEYSLVYASDSIQQERFHGSLEVAIISF